MPAVDSHLLFATSLRARMVLVVSRLEPSWLISGAPVCAVLIRIAAHACLRVRGDLGSRSVARATHEICYLSKSTGYPYGGLLDEVMLARDDSGPNCCVVSKHLQRYATPSQMRQEFQNVWSSPRVLSGASSSLSSCVFVLNTRKGLLLERGRQCQ